MTLSRLIRSSSRVLLAFCVGMSLSFRPLFAEDDGRVKVLLEEALRVYGERQYVRALDLFKQIQRIDPENKTAKDYVQNCEQRIMEWEKQEGGSKKDEKDPTWDSLLKDKKNSGVETVSNASDIVAARRSLVERMRNRSASTDNIVQIHDTKRGIEITLFHDQLFLPGLQTLRDEALPVLENVAQAIRSKGDRPITIRSITHENSTDPFLLYPDFAAGDASSPQASGGAGSMLFQDIEATRAFILFTYIAQRSMSQPAEGSKE